MGENKVRRLRVIGRDKRLVRIVSSGDVALYADSKQTDTAISTVFERLLPWDWKAEQLVAAVDTRIS